MARALLAAVLVAGLASCGSDGDETVRVFAAASLTEAFSELAAAFDAAHPGVDIEVNLAGSSTLREQILEGAPADVFASADQTNMERLVEAEVVDGEPVIFARNRLQIAVPQGNPAGIAGLADLADEGLLVGLCAEAVPCGDLARQALALAGVDPSIDTNEPDVRALLTKVAEGELDAGVVYATDVLTDDLVDGVEIPPAHNVEAAYPIAVLADAADPGAASAFLDLVLAAEGRAILRRHGFIARTAGRGEEGML